MSLQSLFPLILPPVVGAVIGLFTNWLAIKMLFRPLEERRFLGIRVPFTPGILPRERSRIARSMGDTVATDLLDDSTIASRLKSPAFKDAIKQAALKAGRKLLETNPSELASAIDSRMVEMLKSVSIEALTGLAASETFSSAVASGTGAALATASDAPLSSFVSTTAVERLAAAASSRRGADYLGGAIADAVMSALSRAAADGKRLSSFIDPESLGSFVSRTVESAYPTMMEGIKGIFADRTIKASMEKVGARIIRRALDRFNTVQRFFIGLGQYDKAILDNMPATIADFSESVNGLLEESSTKAAIIARVSAAAAGFAEKPLSEFSFLSDGDARNEARGTLAATISASLSSMDVASAVSYASGLLEKSTVGGALGAFPELGDRMGHAVAAWAAGLFGGENRPESAAGKIAGAFFSAFSLSFKERASGVPLGRTLTVNDSALEALAASASEGLVELAASESSDMLRSMDIRSLVIEKIDSLDMIDVERMILRVVDKELGAITVFGGILGALIGVFQSLLFFLR